MTCCASYFSPSTVIQSLFVMTVNPKNHPRISSDFLYSKTQDMLQALLAELCLSMSYRELSLNEDNATQHAASGSLQATPAEILQDREPFGPAKEASTGQNANQMPEDDGPIQDAKSQAQERGQSQDSQLRPRQEHPSNHEWISDTAQRILLEETSLPAAANEDEASGSQPTADAERGPNSAEAQHQQSSLPMSGGMQRAEDGCIDPDVFASLPPEIQREVKLASMMKLGAVNKPLQQQRNPKPFGKPPTAVTKQQKKKAPNIANFFSAKQ